MPPADPARADSGRPSWPIRSGTVPTLADGFSARLETAIGLAAQLETDRSIEQVIIRADDALYRAKHAGRNQVATDQRPEAA